MRRCMVIIDALDPRLDDIERKRRQPPIDPCKTSCQEKRGPRNLVYVVLDLLQEGTVVE